MSFPWLEDREGSLNIRDRNLRIVKLIEQLFDEEWMIDFTHELTERFLLLTDRSKLLLDRLKAGEFEGAGDKLAAQYIRIDKVKWRMQEAHRMLERMALYIPIKKAILEDPDIEDYKWTNLDTVLSRLEEEESWRKEANSKRDSIFINFNNLN